MAFREYIRTWAFKHPTPADFFRMMRDASGMELDWFWRAWVFSTARLDQAVDSVVNDPERAKGTTIYLRNRGTMVMPVELAITFVDGGDSPTIVRLPVEMWNLGPAFEYHVADKRMVFRVEIDPRHVLPDVNHMDKAWWAPH
jgi:aminopeptidase N